MAEQNPLRLPRVNFSDRSLRFRRAVPLNCSNGAGRYVRYWPKADIPSCTANVCFRGESGYHAEGR
jgi:hypothetical protein